jgi:hypothetical protein
MLALRLLLASTALVAFAASARAETESSRAETSAASASAERPFVRIALGPAAAERLSDVRLRRLAAFQLAESARVGASADGPLDEGAVRVFVELRGTSTVVVQAQAPGRRIDTRTVDVEGLPWDVAQRFVAIGISEMVRAQLAPVRKPRPRPPTEDEVVAGLAARSTIELRSSAVAAFDGAPGAPIAGSRFDVSVRQPWLDAHALVGVLADLGACEGPARERCGRARLELGLGGSELVWLDPDARLELGVEAAAALGSTALDSGATRDEPASSTGREHRSEGPVRWLRATAVVGAAYRADERVWLEAAVEPGVVVEPGRGDVGAWVGGRVGIAFEAP